MSETLVYLLDNKIYINLTNRCTNKCIFCLRQDKTDVCGQEMWLDSENFSAEDVITQLKKVMESFKNAYNAEITFCGYGEPTLKLDILKEVAKYIKDNYGLKTRLNTNGHANYIYKRNVAPELKGLIDVISVSLNAPTKEEYNELSQPNFDSAYEEVKNFVKSCTDNGIETVATVVEGYKDRHIDLPKCEQIAADLGAKFRVREWIEGGY